MLVSKQTFLGSSQLKIYFLTKLFISGMTSVKTWVFDCCKQSLKWILHPSIHPHIYEFAFNCLFCNFYTSAQLFHLFNLLYCSTSTFFNKFYYSFSRQMFKFPHLFVFFFHMLQFHFCLSFKWHSKNNILYLQL